MMEIQAGKFDREFSLCELLSAAVLGRLGPSLAALLGEDFRLTAADGEIVLGGPAPPGGARRIAFRHDLEPIAYLESAHADEARLSVAAGLVEKLLQRAARYRMASEVHIEAIHADYEALQQKHAALVESEARYKALSENLEQRVKEQVKTIEQAERQLYQAEKMASVGQLAAGVAHEINNPIGFIRSNLNTARAYLGKMALLAAPVKARDVAGAAAAWEEADLDYVLEDFASLLAESSGGADRVARIVADLKGFSSIDRTEHELANLNDNLRSVCNVAVSQTRDRAEVILEPGEIPPLRCQAGRLNQVFLNLLLNAAQAMKERGEIRIRSALEDDEIVIRFSDTGCGMEASVLSRIFDPFFTTRDVGSGTGLGLTVSRDIVQAHGGRIEVESKAGAGTTFTIRLPLNPSKT